MALALYRRFRPKQFKDVVDQTDIATALKNQVAAGKISHAYLFTGIRGTGKTTLARILAKAVNCKHAVGGEPCGVCEICTGIDNGSILDVTEIDAASNNGVDNIRDLRDETAYTPAVTDKRVYIIDEVHMLSTGAFNALLKIMEEPPEHVMFILATTELHKVPATILSRCQRFDLKRISTGAIADYLLEIAKEEGWTLTPDAAAIIARLADGAMRDALSILDTCASLGDAIDEEMVRRFSGGAERAYLFSLAESIANGDISAAMRQIDELYAESVNPATLAGELLSHFRDLLMVTVGGVETLADYSAEEVARYKNQAAGFSKEEIIAVLKSLKELATSLPNAVDKRLELELSFIELCGKAAGRKIDETLTKNKIPAKPLPTPEIASAKESPDLIPLKQEIAKKEQPDEPKNEDVPPWDLDTAQPREVKDAGKTEDSIPEIEKDTAVQKDDSPPWDTELPAELDGQVGFGAEEPLEKTAKASEMPPWDLDATPLEEPKEAPRENPEDINLTNRQREQQAAQETHSSALQRSEEPQDGAFAEWPRVIDAMKQKNGMLYGFMLGSTAYRTPTHILIDCSDSFKEQLRERKEYANVIKEAISEVTGLRMPIGPYNREAKKAETPKEDDPLEQLAKMAKENDIPVDIK